MPQYIGSSTPIAAGETYVSQWVLVDIFKAITGSILTDQPGTIYIEQSGDASQGPTDPADISADYSLLANAGEGYSEAILLPWVRLRFTNTSGDDQTSLRLFSRFLLGEMP